MALLVIIIVVLSQFDLDSHSCADAVLNLIEQHYVSIIFATTFVVMLFSHPLLDVENGEMALRGLCSRSVAKHNSYRSRFIIITYEIMRYFSVIYNMPSTLKKNSFETQLDKFEIIIA